MKVNYKWLKEYIKGDLPRQGLEDILTFAGIEVEAVIHLGKELERVIVAEIVEKEKHPDADKLSVCKVFDGKHTVQVVCGAPNCEQNQKIAFAPVGSKIGEIEIKKIKLRGVESSGMICSEKELQLSDDHSGIMVLPDDATLGISLADFLDRNDVCYELEITPNRPDLLGVVGIARDIAAATKQTLQFPKMEISESEQAITDYLTLKNHNPLKCPRYTARMIRNVVVQESPAWLKNHLLAIGLRPINNIVDITNFVMMEFGHPLHAFDYDKIEDKTIIIRDAEEKELFPALDEETYHLSKDDLVIADGKKPIALAGVMGGSNSHITETTKNIVLEAANFAYSTVRKTSGKYKIFTDSSYRFERDLADETTEIISKRATQLILEIAGGELCCGVLDSYPQPLTNPTVDLRMDRLQRITTVAFSKEEVIEYLKNLELQCVEQSEQVLTFLIPSFRKDLTREIDLIEEVIRLHGYNNVEDGKERAKVMNRSRFFQRRNMQDMFLKYGFHEVVNWSFGAPDDVQKIHISGADERSDFVRIKNPLGSSYSIMRSTLLPGLLRNAKYNLHHGETDFGLFENSKVFFQGSAKLAEEKEMFAGIICGQLMPLHWSEQPRSVDFFDVKGLLEDCLHFFQRSEIQYRPSEEPFYQKGVAADVFYRDQKIASLGKLDNRVLDTFEIEKPMYHIEISFSLLTELSAPKIPTFQEISKYPTIVRDLSFLVSKHVSVQELETTILQVEPNIIQKVILFDEFVNQDMKDELRSLSFSIHLNSFIKTLTDEYVNNLLNTVIEILQKKYQIEMR